MFSLEDERRRKINLGGVSVTSSQASILERVHAQRLARAETKRRIDSAIRIQAWYRGLREVRAVRRELRKLFAEDVLSLTALRCLVLIGKDQEVLSTWVTSVLTGEAQVFSLANGPQKHHWKVLACQASLLLLQSAAAKPLSQSAESYLEYLNILLSTESASIAIGSDGVSVVQTIVDYLFRHGFYNLLGQCVQQIPIKSKESPCLPLLFRLAVRPLAVVPTPTPQYSEYLLGIFTHLLTIPILPSRMPLDVLSQFVASLPLTHFEILAPHITTIAETSLEGRINLAATLHMFVSPHYKLLSPVSFQTYLRLCVALFNSFPPSITDPHIKDRSAKLKSSRYSTFNGGAYDSDDSEADIVEVSAVSSFQPLPPLPISLPKVDDKTIKRLTTIVSAQHLRSVIYSAISDRTVLPQLILYLFAITVAWSSSRGHILDTVLASTNGGLVREIYREFVRNSPLGKSESSGVLADPANWVHFPPLIFLVDLYTQALLTMGDDEFFSTSTSSRRNPLSLDELVAFSKQLLNIAFPLYWRDDCTIGEAYVSKDVRCTWGLLKEKLTKCLLAVHARDSRKPFVPPDHWLATSQLDVNSFVEAAVIEEQLLASSGADYSKQATAQIHQRAAITPRLGILNKIPFAIPFAVRVTIFRHFVVNDMRERGSLSSYGSWSSRFDPFLRGTRGTRKSRVQVRRGMVAQDGFDRLAEVDMKAPLEIAFIDQFGQEEAGIDGGGLFKEFFTSLCKEVFDTDRGLWLANKKNELYPNPHTYATEPHSLNWYRFIGRVLGKAMYEGILVDVAFAGFFLSKWLGRQSFLDDLASLDPELYNGLIFLKHYDGNLEDLALNFTVATDEFGVAKTTDLIPNGSNIAVTKENRLLYIHLISHHRLSKQIKKQSEAFFEGLSEMINQRWLRMFNQQEAQILIGGANTPIDIADLQQHTNYGGLFDANHPTIVAFWTVVESFDQDQRKSLLRFVTSCSRPPLLGFRELIPNFSIRDAGVDEHRLPSSSTCVNLLKLPPYSNERTLRTKLLQAVNAGAGFDLS